MIQSLQKSNKTPQRGFFAPVANDTGDGAQSGSQKGVNAYRIPFESSEGSPSQVSKGKTPIRRNNPLSYDFETFKHLRRPPANIRPRFILLCVPKGRGIKADIIELQCAAEPDPICIDGDDTFFEALRTQVRELRGFWRHYFDPNQFAFCHVSKFEKFDIKKVGWLKNEFPTVTDYEFIPRPPQDPYVEPLSRHEWEERFYQLVDNRGSRGVTVKLPKRGTRFQLATHPEREYVWGLYVQLRPSWKMILAWQALWLLGGCAFMIWWLADHHNDWSKATIPLTVIFGGLGIFWSSLGDRYKIKDG
jgi:hypothetical protein